jgi:hypothetical protein
MRTPCLQVLQQRLRRQQVSNELTGITHKIRPNPKTIYTRAAVPIFLFLWLKFTAGVADELNEMWP